MTPPISFTEDGRKHLDELYGNAVDAGRTWTDDDSSASDIDADLFLAEVGKHWPAISVALAAYDAQSRRIAELVETARIEAVHAQEWEKTARAANVRLAELQRALEELWKLWNDPQSCKMKADYMKGHLSYANWLDANEASVRAALNRPAQPSEGK